MVFIDILGFGSLVEAAAHNPDGNEAIRLSTALQTIENLAVFGSDNEGALQGADPHVQIFSDSIILSIAPSPTNAKNLLLELSRLFVRLMIQGIWIRGGISYGKISKNHLSPCGPAVNIAYRIESQIASSPRIALSASIVEYCRNHSPEILDSVYCERDEDGVFAVSPLKVATENETEFGFDIRDYAESIRDQLNNSLEQIVDRPDQFRKVNELADRWNWVADSKKGFFKESYRTKRYIDFVDQFNFSIDDLPPAP